MSIKHLTNAIETYLDQHSAEALCPPPLGRPCQEHLYCVRCWYEAIVSGDAILPSDRDH